VTSVPVKITLAVSPTLVPADGVSSANLTATVRDAAGRIVIEPSRTIAFAVTSGALYARLSSTSAVATNGVASVSVFSTTTPGIVTVAASSTGLSGDSISVPIGLHQVANQVRDYLSRLHGLRPKGYDVGAASALVDSYGNSTDVRNVDALSRLMLAEKAIYHFYGTGDAPRAFDNEPATPGASMMLKDEADHIARAGALVFSLMLLNDAINAKVASLGPLGTILGAAGDAFTEVIDKTVSAAVDFGGLLFDEELKSINSRALDLVKSALKDYEVRELTGVPGVAALRTVAEQAAESVMEDLGTAYYISKTQAAQDAAATAARNHEGTGSIARADFDVDSHINMARYKTQVAHIYSESEFRVADWMNVASEILDLTTALGGGLVTQIPAVASKVVALTAAGAGAIKSYQVFSDLKEDLPAAVAAAFPVSVSSTRAVSPQSALDNTLSEQRTKALSAGLLARQLHLRPAVPQADAVYRYLGTPLTSANDYEIVAQRIIAALDAPDAAILTPLGLSLAEVGKKLSADLDEALAALRATAAFSSYLTAGFSESYAKTLALSTDAPGLRSNFLFAIAAVLAEPDNSAQRSAAKEAGRKAIQKNAELLQAIQQTGTLSLGNPSAPTVAVVAHEIRSEIALGVPFAVSVTLLNAGSTMAQNVSVELLTTSEYRVSPQSRLILGDLPAGGRLTVSWQVTLTDAKQQGGVIFNVVPQATNAVVQMGTLITSISASGGASQIKSVVNGASFAPGLAPGAVASIFGTNLADTSDAASSVPLPTTLGNAQVIVNGVPVPLFFASPTQVNFQIPFETPVGTASVAVSRGGVSSTLQTASIQPVAPAAFALNSSARGAILRSDFSVVSPANPAARGEAIAIYCTGLGQVTPPVKTGSPGETDPLSASTVSPSVLIGGKNAAVLYSGLAPGLVGVYQINVLIPEDAPAGAAIPVLIAAEGRTSNIVTVAIKY
jgi:uncharacterized protein (TIGR03437 family)